MVFVNIITREKAVEKLIYPCKVQVSLRSHQVASGRSDSHPWTHKRCLVFGIVNKGTDMDGLKKDFLNSGWLDIFGLKFDHDKEPQMACENHN